MFTKRARRYPGKGETLLKYIYLNDAEVAYRFATTAPLTRERLDTYYNSLAQLHDDRRKAFTAYLVIFAASVLATFNGIREASTGGISVSSDFLKHAALILWPWAQCRLGLLEAKFGFIAGVFNQYLVRQSPQDKVETLLRYPLAISYHEYYLERIGDLPFLIRMRFPIRLAAFSLLACIGLLAYLSFAVWIYVRLAIAVVQSPGVVPAFWSWCIVLASVAMMLFSYALPATGFLRKRYTHMGLVRLISSVMNRDRKRHSHFAVRIHDAGERLRSRSE